MSGHNHVAIDMVDMGNRDQGHHANDHRSNNHHNIPASTTNTSITESEHHTGQPRSRRDSTSSISLNNDRRLRSPTRTRRAVSILIFTS